MLPASLRNKNTSMLSGLVETRDINQKNFGPDSFAQASVLRFGLAAMM